MQERRNKAEGPRSQGRVTNTQNLAKLSKTNDRRPGGSARAASARKTKGLEPGKSRCWGWGYVRAELSPSELIAPGAGWCVYGAGLSVPAAHTPYRIPN
jgi:hypothetical protein